MDIHSYRAVFDLERRIYRVDRLRLNPGGVPVRGVLYFLAILAFFAIVRSLPLVSAPLDLLPWYLGEVALPALIAALLASVKLDGRPFHLAAWATLSYSILPRELCGHGQRCPGEDCQWRPEELIVIPDGSDAEMRSMLYLGPGAVLVSTAHDHVQWPDGLLTRLLRLPHLTLRPLPGERLQRRQLVELEAGVRLKVSGSR